MKHVHKFSLIFLFLAILDLLSVWFYPEVRWVTKPLILLSLICHFYINITEWTVVKRIFWIGLWAALLGDIFLLFSQEYHFLLGLCSFLLMQLFYSFAFIKNSFHLSKPKILYGILLALTLYFYLNSIWVQLDTMQIPVLVYSSIIAFMAFFAVTRDTTLKGYWYVVIGAMFFMVSDGFIAWNKFIEPLHLGGLIVMSTYILAQFLIVTGFLKSLESKY